MKKGQSVVVGFAMLTIIAILFIQIFMKEFEDVKKEDDPFLLVQSDGGRLADILAGGSTPYTWTASAPDRIQKLGLVTGQRVLTDTLNQYTQLQYSKTKLLLGTSYDYIFFFENESGLVPKGTPLREYWGWNDGAYGNGGTDLSAIQKKIDSQAEYLVVSERFIQLDSQTATMVVYTWI